MLRLSMLLGATIFVTLLIAGEDKGQMRPGLERALAEGREIVTIERRRAPEVVMAVAEPAVHSPALRETIRASAAGPSSTAAIPAAADRATPPVLAGNRDAVRAAPAPVFTLSAYAGGAPAATPAATPAAAVDSSAADASIFYVSASSVNVRAAPTTQASVVDRLASGEAVTVLSNDGEWAHVIIEGDGLEGYVAARFLGRSAP